MTTTEHDRLARTAILQQRRSITPDQCRAARALLNWSQEELAAYAAVTRKTITSFELGKPLRVSTRRRLRTALEQRGMEFFWSGSEHGEGVWLRAEVLQPAPLPYVFDRNFYESQAQLIASLALDPANIDIRSNLLSLAGEYKLRAAHVGSAGGAPSNQR